MVFSSVPLYLDPPNWQQHQNQQLQGGNNNNNSLGNENNHQHLIAAPSVPHQSQTQVGIGGGTGGQQGAPPMRPNSMAERARLAKIPPPELPLKCPRCSSTNTKFCYFNNYSLTQPRHFCKGCRRYWTRGGALRNVPVGGGCRRNKRSNSKSSSGTSGGGGGGGTSSSSKSSLSSHNPLGGGGDHHQRHSMDHMVSNGSLLSPPTINGIPSGGSVGFLASLQNIAQMSNLGLTFGGSFHHGLGGLSGNDHGQLDYISSGNGASNMLNSPTTPVQFPNFLGGFEIPGSSTSAGGGLYSSSFQGDQSSVGGDCGGDGGSGGDDQVNNSKSSSTMMSQFAPIKMEGQGQRLNLAMMGMATTTDNNNNNNNNNVTGANQFWSGTMANNTATAAAANMWTDLSGLNSSSSTHLL